MKIIRGRDNLQPRHRGTVITIGNFDGVHLGHQALLKAVVDKAKEIGLLSTVVIFEPQPAEYFLQEEAIPRLTRLREKCDAFAACGIEQVLCLRFNHRLADISAEDFTDKILCAGLGVKHIIIGEDFRFGAKRLGDVELLKKIGETAGFQVSPMSEVTTEGIRVSSTAIRQALDKGDLDGAAILLGRPFMLTGRVAHGDKRGRIIGFPTANIHLHRKAVPIRGVYAVKVHGIIDNNIVYGVANVGNRPTVDGARTLLEVHLFDFSQHIYGQQIQVEFVKKLRDEKQYDNFDALKAQIFCDANEARAYFNLG